MITRKPSWHFVSGGTRITLISDLFCISKHGSDLSQLEFLDLAAGGARKVSHDLHTFRPELFCHLRVTQIGLYRVEIDGAPGAGNDERAAALAEPSIRKADHGDGSNGRMLVERVLPAPDQDVLHPA